MSTEKPPLSTASAYLGACYAIADVELHKLIRDSTALISRAIRPLLWLLVFG